MCRWPPISLTTNDQYRRERRQCVCTSLSLIASDCFLHTPSLRWRAAGELFRSPRTLPCSLQDIQGRRAVTNIRDSPILAVFHDLLTIVLELEMVYSRANKMPTCRKDPSYHVDAAKIAIRAHGTRELMTVVLWHFVQYEDLNFPPCQSRCEPLNDCSNAGSNAEWRLFHPGGSEKSKSTNRPEIWIGWFIGELMKKWREVVAVLSRKEKGNQKNRKQHGVRIQGERDTQELDITVSTRKCEKKSITMWYREGQKRQHSFVSLRKFTRNLHDLYDCMSLKHTTWDSWIDRVPKKSGCELRIS